MRASKRFNKRGFTLVELMIVVAIIGVLAALAIYGVSRYLASAKTSEAKNNVGAITRAAVAAFERESYANAMLPDGANSLQATHSRCDDKLSGRVPAATPANTKYQPNRGAGVDFNTGNSQDGWQCLQFSIDQPIYFSYGYVTGTGTGLSGATSTGFEVNAFGDLDGDGAGAVAPGANISTFARGADIDANGSLKLSTTIFIQNETE